MKLKTKMSLILGMTILSVTPVMQAKAIDVLTYDDIKCTETKEWKEYKKLSAKDRKGTIPPIQCEEMKTKSSNIKTVGAPLINDAGNSTKFDLRNVNGKNYITPVKNQYQTGLCWAFATASSIESNYLINSQKEINVSELHIGYSTSYQLKDGINPYGLVLNGEGKDTVAQGGNISIAQNYLSQRRGIITEEKSNLILNENNYNTIVDSKSGTLKDVNLNNEYNVNDVIVYSPGKACTDNDNEAIKTIKQMVASYGSVYTQVYMPSLIIDETTPNKISPNLYDNSKTANHAVSIVGWDDNYSASNFVSTSSTTPAGNGAWLIKNSYGTKIYVDSKGKLYYEPAADRTEYQMGNDGYFYVSYYDKQICQSVMAVDNVEPATDVNKYSYAKPGLGYITTPILSMTKFDKKNTDAEVLESFNVGTLEKGDNVKIYFGTEEDFQKATLVAEKNITNSGATNIKANKKITITSNSYYIFMLYTNASKNTPINPVYTPYSSESNKLKCYEDVTPKVGYSFYSLDNGATWSDSIGDGVKIGFTNLLNFYTDISVFTTTKDYNLSISTSTDDTISAEDGGSVSVTLDLKNVTGNITTKIYNSNKQDVTNKFKVTNDSNKYTIAGIVGTTTAGTYTAEFTYKDAVATKTFKVISTAPSNVLVEKITIAGKTEVIAGGYLVLDATVTPKDATNKVLTWSSSDRKVATVDQEGIVKAVNEGTATITAEATDGSKVKGTIKIKVIGKKVEQISNDVKDDTNKDTNKSPETGLTSITTALLITMLLSVIAYVVFKKKNLFKRV
ncbi:MAG: C1 family peptidase [Bacilli bacterium]